MSAPDRAAIEAKLAGIRREFLERSLRQVEALGGTAATPALSRAERAEAIGTVHRIAGAAGTFGLHGVASVAGALEDALTAHGRARGTAAGFAAVLNSRLAGVRASLERAAGRPA